MLLYMYHQWSHRDFIFAKGYLEKMKCAKHYVMVFFLYSGCNICVGVYTIHVLGRVSPHPGSESSLVRHTLQFIEEIGLLNTHLRTYLGGMQ